jgi:DnaJ-domain-containing protein 1
VRHVCPLCHQPQPLLGTEDFFSTLGVPRAFRQEGELLQKHFYQISRVLHPDRFSRGSAEARELSMKRMSWVNQAYTTLRSEVTRRAYLVQILGTETENSARSASPSAVTAEWAEAWFDIQDQLEDQVKVKAFFQNLVIGMKECCDRIASAERQFDQTQQKEFLLQVSKEIQLQTYFQSLQKDIVRLTGHDPFA